MEEKIKAKSWIKFASEVFVLAIAGALFSWSGALLAFVLMYHSNVTASYEAKKAQKIVIDTIIVLKNGGKLD
jgi:hypothetical protein